MKSIVKSGGNVVFPAFTGERVYMVPFTKAGGLPVEHSRWSSLVASMVEGIETDGVIYFMADQGVVKAGDIHRRGGAHIDGNYGNYNGALGFSGDGGGTPGFKIDMCYKNPIDLLGGIVLASDYMGCKSYEGDFNGSPAYGGDCSHLDLSTSRQTVMQPNQVYMGNVTMVHEAIPSVADQNRTVVRLILPDDYKLAA